VAEVVYSRHAFADLERLADFLIKDAPQAAVKAIEVIRDGIEILERHPFVYQRVVRVIGGRKNLRRPVGSVDDPSQESKRALRGVKARIACPVS